MLIAGICVHIVFLKGLSDDQFNQLFIVLEDKPGAQATYEKWIDSIPSQMVHPSIRSFKGS